MNKIQLKRGTSARWIELNPLLTKGEPGYETDTGKLKIGDGISYWIDLPYFANGSSPITDENIQDIIGNGFFIGGQGISLEYNDENNTLTINSTGAANTGDITFNASTISTVNADQDLTLTTNGNGDIYIGADKNMIFDMNAFSGKGILLQDSQEDGYDDTETPSVLKVGSIYHATGRMVIQSDGRIEQLGSGSSSNDPVYGGIWITNGVDTGLSIPGQPGSDYAGDLSIRSNGSEWLFKTSNIDLHNGGIQSAQILQFNDNSQQSVITGPTPSENSNAQRIIVQGQRGTGSGEGGDVYLWGGDSDTNGGDIKIYAGDADSNESGYGGYVNISAGSGFNQGGNLELKAGNSANNSGFVQITTSNTNNWTFTKDGDINLPNQLSIMSDSGPELTIGDSYSNINLSTNPISNAKTVSITSDSSYSTIVSQLEDNDSWGGPFSPGYCTITHSSSFDDHPPLNGTFIVDGIQYTISAYSHSINDPVGFITYSPTNDLSSYIGQQISIIYPSPIHLPKVWQFNENGDLSVPGKITLPNGTYMSRGSFDNDFAGDGGISLHCLVGYELNWQGGHLKSTFDNGATAANIWCDSPIEFPGTGSENVIINNNGLTLSDGTNIVGANQFPYVKDGLNFRSIRPYTGENTVGQGWSVVSGGLYNVSTGLVSVVGGGTYNGVTSNYSTISGGSYNGILSDSHYSTISGGSYNNISGNGHSTIAGGFSNTIISGSEYSSIIGGKNNSCSGYATTVCGGKYNTSSTFYSVVGGGKYNNVSGDSSTISGGSHNTASGYYSVVGGGQINNAVADRSTIGGGETNETSGYASTVGGGISNFAYGDYSTIGGGTFNLVNTNYSTIPGGACAKTSKYGEFSHASGMFQNEGDAQHTILIVRRETGDATANVVLTLDGQIPDSTNRLTIRNGTTWSFDIKISAYNTTDNIGGAWKIVGGIRRNLANGTSILGTNTSTTWTEGGMSSVSVSAVADDTNDALEIRVTGLAGKNIRWVGVIDISQVSCR